MTRSMARNGMDTGENKKGKNGIAQPHMYFAPAESRNLSHGPSPAFALTQTQALTDLTTQHALHSD